jgi:endonuclease/exonuclease/phosphatase family metal-dependent hydrolase
MPARAAERPAPFARTAQTGLIALTTLVALELLRVSGPVLDAVAGRSGVPLAALAAVLTYGAAALAGPLTWWLGSREALFAALCALAGVRLVLQIPAARGLPLVALGVALALISLLLAVRSVLTGPAAPDGPARAARAVALGVALDVALRLPLDLWDPVWRGGLLGWTTALLLAAALAGLGYLRYREGSAAPVTVTRELAVLGPVLALTGVFLASPAFLAAQGAISQTSAGLWIAAGLGAGIAVLSLPAPPQAGRGAALLLAVAVLVLLAAPGALSGPVTLLALALLPALLARALDRRGAPLGGALLGRLAERVSERLPGRSAAHSAHDPAHDLARPSALSGLTWAGLGCGLGYVLVVLPYQAHYEMPMPVPNATFPLLGAALIGWAAWRIPAPAAPPRPLIPLLAAGLLFAAPPLAEAMRAAPEPLPTDTADGSYTLLSWNLHYGVDRDAEVVPDQILRVIRDSGAHVVVLQEVPRGWPISGGTDLLTWLEQRLDVTAVWSPAADRQFGNLILTSLPVTGSDVQPLPQADGTMKRSYAVATIDLGNDISTRVATVHLQHADARETRLAQLETLLSGHREDPFTVLAGDFNAEPGWKEIDTVLDAGFRSAQDEAGDPQRATSPSHDPEHRIDWIFGTEGTEFESFRLLGSTASDHLPLTVTVHQQ